MKIRLKNETEERMIKYIDENRSVLFSMLCDLIKIDTVNHRTYGNENNAQIFLEEKCRELGLKTDRFTSASVKGLTEHKDYLPGREAEKRENLVAVLEGERNTENIMLAAHIDTETVGDSEKWTDAPFSGIIKDGKIYGRGSGDDKSGVAAAWFLLKAFKDLKIKPERNILLASYCDEEGGGGNGALAVSLKYPSELCMNLDSSGLETQALGGGCFKITLDSFNNERAVSSVFDVFEGVKLVVDKLKELDKREKTKIRFSSAKIGGNGEKTGVINIAVYTDMKKEICQAALNNICAELRTDFERLGLKTEGFILTTRFFIYGETKKDSREARILKELMSEESGGKAKTDGNCLSDLSLFMAYCSENSFNYGVEVGSADGGAPHQANEHIYCDEFISYVKKLAILLLRI